MIDETGTPNPATPHPATPDPAAQAAAPESATAGFCQDCGRPLTQETLRQVGSGVFCDPCLQRRAGVGPIPGAGYGSDYSATGGYVPPHTPSPALAGWLGLIPGVGAMYNGQFAKGIVHLLVFAVLSSLADHGNGIFGLFVFGWICYQSFEAYHTAKARLLGLPLPNPFGLNDIGERLGFGKGWQAGSPAAQGAGTTTPPPASTWTPPAAAWTPGAPNPATAGSDWTGYVPPTAFGAGVPPPVVPTPESWGSTPYHAAPPTQAAYQVPYQQATYPPPPAAQVPYPQTPYATPYAVPPVAAPPSRRFPVGAIWLIALGCLFLAINVGAHFELRGSWLVAVILAGFGAWSLTRNLDELRGLPETNGRARHAVCVLRFPAMLFVLAALFALQAANWLTLGQTWPVLLLALGSLLLLERVLSRADELPAPGFAGYPNTYSTEPLVAATHETVEPSDAVKGGE